MNRYGSSTQENGKITRILNNTWCHQCKMKHQKIVVCDHFWHEDKSVKCNGRYCPNCCKRHYGEEMSDLENLESWTCYKCTGKCVCAACRRLRNGEVTTTKNIPAQIQKGKRKRNNKAKSYEESEEEEEFGEEEFIPMMFEKNLRSRHKNESPTNTTSIPNNPSNNNLNLHPSHNTSQPIKKNPSNLGMQESAKMPIPKKKEIPKMPLEKKVKIHIPEEELEKANSTSNYLFDILLQVTSLESMHDDGAPQKSIGGNNVDSKQNLANTSNLGNPSNNKTNPSDLHPNNSILLNNLIHKIPPSEIKKTDLQKILKYESIQSNPLLPSSFHTIVQLRQEVSSLTSELNNMRQDFMKLQRLFESYSQTNEGSHECSPIADGENYVSHPVENFVHNI